MAVFEKKKPKSGGRKKGAKNKSTILFQFKGITEEDKQTIFKAAMKLVEKGNVTIINKFLDKLFYNAVPTPIDEGKQEPPEFENMSDIELDEYIQKYR